MTDVVVDDMGGTENVTPEARAEFIEERSKEKLAKYFEENDDADPERAKQLADKHFNALMGADKKDRQKSLEVVYATTQQEAKQQGLDAESAAARRTAAVEAERTEDAKQDATITPAKDGTPAKYDYKKLGVTDKVTAEQQALIDQIKRNPTAGYMDELVKNEESKKLLLALPDAAAVDLFKHFSPEDRQKGLANLKTGATANRTLAAVRGYDLSVQDQQNLDRLHTAITKDGGLSSSNVVAPAAYEQRQLPAAAEQALPRAVPPANESEAIQEQLAAIDSRTSANWFTEGRSFATAADEKKHKDLTQRQRELASGDPIGSVRQEMAEINSRKQKGYLYGESFATSEDTARYSELESREKAILADGGAVVQQSSAGVNAARGATASSGPAGVSSTGGTGRSTESLKVNGTLTLNGLQEVLLSAMGQRMEETPDGGAPVSLGAPTGR
jgi:hypothetical protein